MFEVGLWATTTRPTESREDAAQGAPEAHMLAHKDNLILKKQNKSGGLVSGGDPLLRPAASWRTDQCETFDALII